MPVTLAQAKLNVQDALQMSVIDEFSKSGFLFNNLTFDDCVSPTGGGSTLTYAYTRLKTQPQAEFREINSEYSAHEVEKERHIVDLKVFGGAFKIDRIIANMGGIVDETTLQLQQKIKAATALFNDTVINGDSAVDSKAFDGLEKALTGSSTELKPTTIIDLSSSAMIDANYKEFQDILDEFLLGLDGVPSAIMGNAALIAKIRAVARRASMYQVTKNEWGQQVESYGVTPLIDLGAKAGSNDPVSKLYNETVGGANVTGLTSLYTVRLGLDGFHAVSLAGQSPVKTWMPDFKTAGAVKTGEVEMVAAAALKATKAAGVLRRIKVR